MKIILISGLVFFSLVLSVSAQPNAPFKPEQIAALSGLRDVQISPDGEHVAVTVIEPPKGETRGSDVSVYDVRTRALRRFTTAPKQDFAPRWSPDAIGAAATLKTFWRELMKW